MDPRGRGIVGCHQCRRRPPDQRPIPRASRWRSTREFRNQRYFSPAELTSRLRGMREGLAACGQEGWAEPETVRIENCAAALLREIAKVGEHPLHCPATSWRVPRSVGKAWKQNVDSSWIPGIDGSGDDGLLPAIRQGVDAKGRRRAKPVLRSASKGFWLNRVKLGHLDDVYEAQTHDQDTRRS
jgi:hypothetical protein